MSIGKICLVWYTMLDLCLSGIGPVLHESSMNMCITVSKWLSGEFSGWWPEQNPVTVAYRVLPTYKHIYIYTLYVAYICVCVCLYICIYIYLSSICIWVITHLPHAMHLGSAPERPPLGLPSSWEPSAIRWGRRLVNLRFGLYHHINMHRL